MQCLINNFCFLIQLSLYWRILHIFTSFLQSQIHFSSLVAVIESLPIDSSYQNLYASTTSYVSYSFFHKIEETVNISI